MCATRYSKCICTCKVTAPEVILYRWKILKALILEDFRYMGQYYSDRYNREDVQVHTLPLKLDHKNS